MPDAFDFSGDVVDRWAPPGDTTLEVTVTQEFIGEVGSAHRFDETKLKTHLERNIKGFGA